MDTKKWIDYLLNSKFIRLRFFNIRLFGNIRWGLYNEFSANDFITLINDFRTIATPTEKVTNTPSPQPFSAGSNYAILARLCEQYYVYEGSDKLQKKVISEVSDIISELRKDSEAQQELEAYLDAQHNGIMRRFRIDHSTMKENDFRLYSYLVAGFSATTIAVLLGKDKSIVYNRISRLKKAIKEEYKIG